MKTNGSWVETGDAGCCAEGGLGQTPVKAECALAVQLCLGTGVVARFAH
jgi:hypothetical protein